MIHPLPIVTSCATCELSISRLPDPIIVLPFAVYGYVLAYLVVVAYYCGGLLAFELEVLRYGAYYRAGEEYVAATYARSAKDRNAVHKYVVVAYFDVFVDVAESSYLTVFSDFRFGVDVCQRTYFAHFFQVVALAVA